MRYVIAILIALAMTTTQISAEALAEGEPPSKQIIKEETGVKNELRVLDKYLDAIRPATASIVPLPSDKGESGEDKDPQADEGEVISGEKTDRRVALPNARDQRQGKYPYGWCTYYVSTRREVGQWGNAKNWLYGAAQSGYPTGTTPQVGAVVVTAESWLGHVAYVEAVGQTTITFSEMNAMGWGVVSQRTVPINYNRIRGYIY